KRPRRGVRLLAAEREPGPAADDHVQLLVADSLLGVLLDDPVADLLGRVGVDAEGADPEPPPDRTPLEPLHDRDAVELVEMGNLVRHAPRNASSTTGSSRSTPSTRSSGFSLPAQRGSASA